MKVFRHKSDKFVEQARRTLWLVPLLMLAACSPNTATPEATSLAVPATNTSASIDQPTDIPATLTALPTDQPTEIPTIAPTVPTEGQVAETLGAVQGIILFIGDGMGNSQRTAGRWIAVGQNGIMAMDRMQVSGWMATAAYQSPITDSAAAATAMATGYLTRNGRIGVDENDGAVPTILEQAKQRGWATGLVTTTPISHATPAGFAAHTNSRNNHEIISSQMLALGVDVMFGGGEQIWLPSGTVGCNAGFGTRDDGRNLIDEAVALGYTFVCSAADLAALNTASVDRVLGLFATDGMLRPHSPALADMTRAAIEILSRDEDGFFLMVEGGQIDWAGHNNDPEDMLASMVGLNAAVVIGQEYLASAPNTLLIVTADHETGGLNVYLEETGSFREDGPFLMPDGTPFFATWQGTGHTPVDVPVTASGPWAYLLGGYFQITYLYDVMWAAMNGVAP